MPSKADIICSFIATIVFVWDTLTWPIYQVIYRPWQKRAAMYEKKRSRIVRYEFLHRLDINYVPDL